MGWTFHIGSSRKELVAELCATKTWTRDDGKVVTHEVLKRSFSGNHLWAVFEIRIEGLPDETQRVIALFMLDRGSGDGWGYKDLDESCGPCAVSCPMSFFKLVPEPPNEWARDWRENVAKYWARRRERNRLRRERKKARGVSCGSIPVKAGSRVIDVSIEYIAI